jgi:hypothetical protein
VVANVTDIGVNETIQKEMSQKENLQEIASIVAGKESQRLDISASFNQTLNR